ncbi:hypothetical protein ACJX0J_029521 [Zea mays]
MATIYILLYLLPAARRFFFILWLLLHVLIMFVNLMMLTHGILTLKIELPSWGKLPELGFPYVSEYQGWQHVLRCIQRPIRLIPHKIQDIHGKILEPNHVEIPKENPNVIEGFFFCFLNTNNSSTWSQS